jgi:hypothetical protein
VVSELNAFWTTGPRSIFKHKKCTETTKCYNRTNYVKQTLWNKGVEIWNKLDPNFKSINSFQSFSSGRNVSILRGVVLNANIFQTIHCMETEIALFERGELPLSNDTNFNFITSSSAIMHKRIYRFKFQICQQFYECSRKRQFWSTSTRSFMHVA